MKNFGELKKGKLYQDTDGIWAFSGEIHGNTAIFYEIIIDDKTGNITIDYSDVVYKTASDIRNLWEA